MRRIPLGTALLVAAAFAAGLLSYFFYQRWSATGSGEQGYPVTYSPGAPPVSQAEIPVVEAREIEKVRALAGNLARVRGRVYRVGHSVKSNTFFLDFGPSRSSFTAVIFASALESFEKRKSPPQSYEGREVEVTGEVRDHPKYGVEMILEEPSQVRLLD